VFDRFFDPLESRDRCRLAVVAHGASVVEKRKDPSVVVVRYCANVRNADKPTSVHHSALGGDAPKCLAGDAHQSGKRPDPDPYVIPLTQDHERWTDSAGGPLEEQIAHGMACGR
jgi:hypothetical protein